LAGVAYLSRSPQHCTSEMNLTPIILPRRPNDLTQSSFSLNESKFELSWNCARSIWDDFGATPRNIHHFAFSGRLAVERNFLQLGAAEAFGSLDRVSGASLMLLNDTLANRNVGKLPRRTLKKSAELIAQKVSNSLIMRSLPANAVRIVARRKAGRARG
jgi:hypothetical protein